jgi:putative endonuclease
VSHFVYIVRCRDGTLYTGYSVNVVDRVERHNKGLGAKYTRSRLPVKVVYTEEFETRGDALSREYAIKQLTRKQKEMLCRAWVQAKMKPIDREIKRLKKSTLS